MSPSLTAILKGCFGGWSTSTTSSMWIWWALPFSELGIWRYGRTLFAIDYVLLFSPWLILIRFDATDQSHLQLPEIHCTNSCLKTNSLSGLLHEEEKRNSCEEGTSTHLFFVPIFAHDLRPHAQVLATSWFVQGYEDKISWEKDFYKEMRKENLLRG